MARYSIEENLCTFYISASCIYPKTQEILCTVYKLMSLQNLQVVEHLIVINQ